MLVCGRIGWGADVEASKVVRSKVLKHGKIREGVLLVKAQINKSARREYDDSPCFGDALLSSAVLLCSKPQLSKRPASGKAQDAYTLGWANIARRSLLSSRTTDPADVHA